MRGIFRAMRDLRGLEGGEKEEGRKGKKWDNTVLRGDSNGAIEIGHGF